MKKLLNYFLIVLFAGAIVACGDDDDGVLGPITEQQAETTALASLSGTAGTVTSTDVDTTLNNELYFDVHVTTSEGAKLEFEYFIDNGELKSIEGDSGPFDYEVSPGMGLVNFSIAKAAAVGSLNAQPAMVLRWELEFDTARGIWVYTFELLDANEVEHEVKVNATTGAVI